MRQNFLTRESFVDASEQQAKDSLFSIPAFAPNIRLVAENKMNESIRFSYELPVKKIVYHIDAAVLPLNREYTRISLHGRHANGHSFSNDADMAIALHDFESAIQAALKGDVSLYKPYVPKESRARKFIQVAATVIASAGVLVLKKKLS